MTNLVPEKRLDRNGKLVTRYVMASPVVSAAARIPSPSVPSDAKFTPTTEQLTESIVRITGRKLVADDGLRRKLKIRNSVTEVTANDVQIYDMLSILRPGDAMALMSQGIKSSSKARSYIYQNKLDYLLIDRKEHAAQALRREIPGAAYLEMFSLKHLQYGSLDIFLDAAEVLAMEDKEDFGIYEDVLDETVRVGDVKSIGRERLAGLAESHSIGSIRDFLRTLKVKDITLEPHQVEGLLDHPTDIRHLSNAPELVEEFGYEKTLSFHSFGAASSMLHRFKYMTDEKTRLSLITYFDDMARVCDEITATGVPARNLSWHSLQFHKANEMHDAGLTPEEAVSCHRGITTMQQILAVRDHGVASSVSGGWL